MKNRLILLTIVLIGIVGIATVQAQEVPTDENTTPLVPKQVVSDSLSTGDVHTYTINLEADRSVYGEVDQQTVDVVVTVYGPDGKTIDTYDNPAHGVEPFQFSSDTAGTHRIEIKPFEQEQGLYAVSIERVEPVATAAAERVDQLMVAYSGNDVPGGVVGVIRDGEVEFAEGYGMANLTHDVLFTTDTPSNIGSVSKQFTAFAIMLLAERGKLSLYDPVQKYIPELPAFDSTVTLRHLLTHTSGYREYLNTLALAGRRILEGDHISPEEVIDIVQRQPELQNEPGAEWNYNNTGYNLLAMVVDQVTDQPFPSWMKKNVFGPLDMSQTLVSSNPSQLVPRSAQGYKPADDGGYRNAPQLGAAMGAGGIYTTVSDLAKWIENFETGTLGNKEIIRRMTTPYVLANGDTTDYGYGLMLGEYQGLSLIQHGGVDGGYRAMLMYFPEIDAGVVIISNNSTIAMNLPGKVAETFLGEHMDEENGAGDESEDGAFDPEEYEPETFDALAGRYEAEQRADLIMTLTREEERFYTQLTGQPKIEIKPTSDSTFAVQGVEARLTFHRGPDGKVGSLTLNQTGRQLVFQRLEEDPWAPSEADRAAYTGRYFSEELQTFYTVAEMDSGLVIKHRRIKEIPLTPVIEDTFNGEMPIGEIVFTHDEAGHVTGLSVSNGRTRGVRFEKWDK